MKLALFDFLGNVLDTSGFAARWQCGLWSSGHGWLHIGSDLLIWAAYFTIPVVLIHSWRKHADLPVPRVVALFGAFIFACGTGHLLEAAIFWWPVYRLAGVVKLVTAIVSWATVFALVRMAPPALELPRAAARAGELEQVSADAVLRARRAEEALSRTIERLELPIKKAFVGTWVLANPEQPMVVNEPLREMLDFSDGFNPKLADFLQKVHLDDRRPLEQAIEKCRQTGESYFREFRLAVSHEDIEHIAMHGGGWKAEGDPDGPYLVTGVCTILEEAELALRVSEHRLRLALEAAHAGFWTWNMADNTLLWDDRMKAMFGLLAADGKTYEEAVRYVHPDDLPAVQAALEEALQGGRQYDLVHRVRIDGSGDWKYVESKGVVERNAAGEPVSMTGVCIDVTERVRAEEGLRNANRELDEFAYVASHDLRAPLRAIDNLAQWIVEDASDSLPETSRRHLEKLQQRARRMERLLDDIQQFSRAGRFSYPSESVDLHALVSDIIQTVAAPKGFDVHIEGTLPTIESPRTPIEQVFLNLIGNAVKHHDRAEGQVIISARERPQLLELVVQDDGPGIPVELQEKAFGMFETLRPRDQVEGSGIGLAVVKKLVQSVGGRIWLESGAARGSTFHFTWPKGGADPA
ncbi:MAG: PAS domain-containing protein [Acidobacteria bacterium]|nr:PAS domain-containing protein [Acidobacteriota bacterium]